MYRLWVQLLVNEVVVKAAAAKFSRVLATSRGTTLLARKGCLKGRVAEMRKDWASWLWVQIQALPKCFTHSPYQSIFDTRQPALRRVEFSELVLVWLLYEVCL